MALVETDAIILRSYDLNDADRIAVAITRDHGVIRGVAKGAKRLKSKFGSGLEPFSVVRLHYYRKESVDLVSINKSDLVRSNFAIAGNIEFLEAFSYIAELVITFSPPDDPNEVLYRLVDSCLDAATNAAEFSAITVYFETWILRISGLFPDLSKCSGCSRPFEGIEQMHFRNGHDVLCSSCNPSKSGVMISPNARDYFMAARRQPPHKIAETFEKFRESINDASRLLSELIDRSAGREIRPIWLRQLAAKGN